MMKSLDKKTPEVDFDNIHVLILAAVPNNKS